MDFAVYWQYTDSVTKFLFFSLLVLSIASWVTAILRIFLSSRLKGSVVKDLHKVVSDEQTLAKDLQSSERKTVIEQVLLKEIGRYRYKSEKGLSIIGTTAAIAPFIGLFGTVWGIFHALHSIGETGQAGLSQVAGPVGEALIMTGLGLAVAIPAVIFYNIIVRINRKVLFNAKDTAYGLLGASAKYNSGNNHKAHSKAKTDTYSTNAVTSEADDNSYTPSLNTSSSNS